MGCLGLITGQRHTTAIGATQEHKRPPPPQGCIRRKGASEAAPEGVRQVVAGGCQSGWGRLLLITHATEAGTWRQGDGDWA